MDRKILIVDDSTVNRMIIGNCLIDKVEKITIVEAANGIEALQILAEQNISVVILDIVMPLKDGIAVLEEIKAAPELKNIPVIMCSALNEIENVEKALSLGALDYFTKPLNAEQARITLPLKVKNALEYYEQKIELVKFYDYIKDEMQLAGELQKSMITDYCSYQGVEIWGRYIPCEKIGGDIFLCKPLEQKVWLMIADVSGHGIAAAMISTMLNVLFNAAIRQFDTPGAVLQSMNEAIMDIFKNSKCGLVSAFVGCLSGNTLSYANAGHPYPFIGRQNTWQVIELKANGLLLGVFEQGNYETHEHEFDVNDSIILYTDGLFDQGKDNGYAEWHLIRDYYEAYQRDFAADTEKALDRLIDFCGNRQGNGFIDDAAIMMIRKKQ